VTAKSPTAPLSWTLTRLPNVAKIPFDVPQVTRAAVMKMRQRVVMKPNKGQTVVQKWPKKRGRPQSDLQKAWVDRFSLVACINKSPPASVLDAATDWAKGTGWFWRDVLTAAMNGNLFVIPGEVKITTPTFYVEMAIAEALAANITESAFFDQMQWDNNVFWSSVTNPNRITFKAAGLYLVGINATFDNTATDKRVSIWPRINGTIDLPRFEVQDISNNDVGGTIVTIWYFHAGDYMEARMLSTQNCNVNMVSAWGVAITPEGLI